MIERLCGIPCEFVADPLFDPLVVVLLFNWPVELVLPELPGMLRWLCSCGDGAAFGRFSDPLGETTEPPIELPVPVELPACPVPVEVPLAPDDAPDDPAEPPLAPPLEPPPEPPPPPWASAEAGRATAAMTRARVLTFIRIYSLDVPLQQPLTAEYVPAGESYAESQRALAVRAGLAWRSVLD